MSFRFVVTCADGLEPLLRQELTQLGGMVEEGGRGAVTVQGNIEIAYRTCLWSRVATRVLLPLFEAEGNTPEALYEKARYYAWDYVFSVGSSFAVHATAARGVKTHTQYVSLKLKDAIVDYFREAVGERPDVKTHEPDAPFHVFVEAEKFTISYDLSGGSLHRRAYRQVQTEAPLKESLAAAILLQAGWPAQFPALLDPMCGSGTFLIEAALIAADIAPGLLRSYYGFFGWKEHNIALWLGLHTEALNRKIEGLKKLMPALLGFDADREALNAALKNANAAGVGALITLEQRELWQLRLPDALKGLQGLLVTNPPYGERLGEEGSIRYLYRALGLTARERLPGWQAAVLCADIQHADALGLTHRGTERLYNGAIPVFVRHGDIIPAEPELPLQFGRKGSEPITEGADFANRLQKNLKAALKEANREGVRCFRVYDADMPEYNLAVDVYEQWLHVQEYAPPKTIDPEKAEKRFKLALSLIREVFGLHRDKVFIKVRTRQAGKKQYEKQATVGRYFEVHEGRARLLVNLTDYLDTGLFLDHRPLRTRIAQEAQGKHFLNLFAYTGVFSVQAALGGAKSTVTVDLSPTYLAWAQKNFALNGIGEANHYFEQADCMEWMKTCREKFDLIFIDPPTFSNSKRTDNVFDIQRDHIALIHDAMRCLNPKGTLYFSNNFRKFVLDNEALAQYMIEDISSETIGFDFQRNPKIHRCWRLRHSGG
jgi:23S rRNA (guanine2445-N2)-methyltransferase / 23S rRNA (guanine2069-N7)-methyltransferase